jgi:uncharacterized FlaG/YvyC family protein
MRRHYYPLDPVSSAGGTTIPAFKPQVAASGDPEQAQSDTAASAQQSPPEPQTQPAAAAQSSSNLQKYLDNALKTSTLKAETIFGNGGVMIIRLVDPDSGKIVLQTPPPAVLAIVAAAEQEEQNALSVGSAATSAGTGSLVNEVA